VAKVRTRCMSCEAPIQFQPGAGSRLCPFCGSVNLVREQLISAPEIELKTDGVFRLLGRGRLEQALEHAERVLESVGNHTRLDFYRACTLFELGRSQEAVYLLIDLTGTEAPLQLRADIHTKLAEALLSTERIDEAMESVHRALELLDGHPTARFIQARILMRQENLVEAIGVLEDTLLKLKRRWKITFPPPRSVILLLLARLYIKGNQHHKAFAPLQNILIQETAAPLHVVAEAARLLGLNYFTSLDSREEGLALIRHGAMLDPENRLGLLDALRSAVSQVQGSVSEEMESFQERRNEILSEIQQAFLLVDDVPIKDPGQVTPLLEIATLGPSPDVRTDHLEEAARHLKLKTFDRGTLYPLRTIEDFRRWVVAWRMRDYLRNLKRKEIEEERILKLRAAREVSATRATYHRQKGRLTDTEAEQRHRRRRILRWSLLSGLVVLAFLTVYLALVGDRLLDRFEGTLAKVECPAEGSACTLHIAAGEAGRVRYRDRQEGAWTTRLLGRWLDRRVQKDGTILYPLGFPLGTIPAEDYKKCVGKPIRKSRLSLVPECRY
jgi:tetratricopeptide (TPR) repeat protein